MRKAKYTTHEGVTVEFNAQGSPYTLNPFPMRSFNIEPQVLNNRVSGFSTETLTTYPVEIGVIGNTAENTAVNYDRLISLFEDDINAVMPGMLTVNGYTLNCYINDIAPSISMRKGKAMTATITAESPIWYKELFTTVFTPEMSFNVNSPSIEETNPIDYPYDYPYDYGSDITNDSVNNTAMRAAHFRLIIEGAVTNPAVTIGGHIYSADVDVPEGGRLIIDSREETVTIIDASGNRSNVFDKRNRESDIFAKIPVGESEVAFRGIAKFYLTIIDERRYPPWSV